MAHSDNGEHELERLRHALDAEARRRLDLQTRLERANADFEEFISVAAHDLRESLREVVAFSQLLVENHAGRLDSGAGVFLGHIQDGAARMQSLLADVVDYWATAPGERLSGRTELDAALRQALLSTERLIEDRSAVVTYDPMPVVMGDFEVLTKVLRHLIRNAIEYGGRRVRVSCRQEGPEWVCSVQDNGPGIEPALQARLFGVFKRLHGREYPGSGLGLAFCRKAIESHGGRMWMESAPGTGSTFHFTLPVAD